jgi:hypothetical protein
MYITQLAVKQMLTQDSGGTRSLALEYAKEGI